MAAVVALVPDLMFGSRVQELLSAAGHEVSLCSSRESFDAAAAGADVVVVDLFDDPGGIAALEDARAAGGLDGVGTLAVYAHTDAGIRARAQAAGFDLVVPRSRMVREGADLVAGLAR